ncbi:MAG: TIGR02266 family protein [Deltaproteobacteria bacterium]|nr:TIGR02266 family protein [Deltaproteobacteria bacterium]
MFNIVSEETYEDDQIIFKEGSSGDWVYVVLSGSVEVSKTIRGKKYVMGRLQPDEVFGELAFFGRVRRTATARAVGKTSVGILDRASLDIEFNGLSADFRAILIALTKRFENWVNRTKEYKARDEARVAKSLSLAYRDRQSFMTSYSTNISSGGLFIKTVKPFPNGEKFLLNLQLPDIPEPLKIDCEVIWARAQGGEEGKPSGMGVKFCEMSKNDKQVLQRYLKEIQPA